MQWLAAFRRALNNVHSAVSQHNSDTIEQPVLDFYFWTSRKTRTGRRPDDSQNHNLTPPLYMFAGATAATRQNSA